MDPHTLASDRLTVVLDPPGTRYLGPRFDWTTQLRQVSLDGHSFLTREILKDPAPGAQGWGLAGEFGIETPVGYQDCPVGGTFSKIGVGLLRRPDDEPYRFQRSYDLTPARFTLRTEGAAALLITADQPADRGYGWFLKRHWAVRGSELTLTTTLANTGSKPLSTEEYIHNFIGFDQLAVDAGWTLTLPRDLEPAGLAKLVDPENLLSFGGRNLTWTRTPTKDFFFCDRTPQPPATWTLSHRRLGLSVTETVDFPVANFNLWGHGHVVSPELYRTIEVAPGGSMAWTRRWLFQKGAEGL